MVYSHTRYYKFNVPFEYKCEHCGKDSGMQTAEFNVGATSDLKGVKLSDKADDKLTEKASKNAIKFMEEYRRDVEEKQKYSIDFPNKCPHCGKHQCWGKGNLPKNMLIFVVACGLLGGIISQLSGINIMMFIFMGFMGLFVGAILGFPLLQARQSLFPPKPKHPPVVHWNYDAE